VLGWLGDGESYVDNQAEVLAASTFSSQFGTRTEQQAVVDLIADSLADLEQRGYVLAASPYRLTASGQGARITGLSAPSVSRLEAAIERGRDGWLLDLVGVDALSRQSATHIARLLCEGLEVVEHSLWLRRVSSNLVAKFEALVGFAAGDDTSYYQSGEYDADVDLLASWMLGASYVELARRAPVYSHAAALFGGSDEPKRTSDATEYVGKLTYPGGWVWSGARVLAGSLGETLPAFVRNSIEFGLPSEAATTLALRASLTRPAALAVSQVAGSSWQEVVAWLTGDTEEVLASLGLTTLDRERLIALRDNLILSDE
jgi:hypothetical protein